MSFKKKMQSEVPIIVGNSSDEKDLFRPGYSYRLGGTVHTVVEDVTKDPGAELRRVQISDGSTEIISVSSIKKDIKAHDAEVLPLDTKFVEKKGANDSQDSVSVESEESLDTEESDAKDE